MKQYQFSLERKPRGFHIVTREILSHLGELPASGLLHLFIQHTSAGICINENADPSVLHDMNMWFDKNIQEEEPYYLHTYEGTDDMPAHIKSVLTGNSLTIPIKNHELALGTWQGIYLCEFRNMAYGRKLIATIQGFE